MNMDYSQISGISELFLDYTGDFEKVKEFYQYSPFEHIDFTLQFEKLSHRKYDRNRITDILLRQNRVYGSPGATLESIEKLREEKTFVVFTGQQAGLFGGPLYTLYKALTAVNLALYLTLHTPYTILPIFWIEGEDHDFREIQSTFIMDRENRIRELKYQPENQPENAMVGNLILEESISDVIEEYSRSIHDSDFKENIIRDLKECYAPGITIATAFARWMTKLTGETGLIIADPSDPEFKEMTAPVFLQALKSTGRIEEEIDRTSHALQEKGYHAQVKRRSDTLDFFYCLSGRRFHIQREKENYRVRDTDISFTEEELESEILNNPENFSPNVILRPQIQDSLFPTASYVAGPSETAYFGQFRGIYEIFGNPMPVIYPRRSATILEERVEKLMKRYGIDFQQVMADSSAIYRKAFLQSFPESLTKAMETAEENIRLQMENLEKNAVDFEPNLGPVIKRTAGRIQREYSSARTRIIHEIEKRDSIIREHIDRIINSLFPSGNLQERCHNILNYLYRYDYDIIDSLRCVSCHEKKAFHRLWKMEPMKAECQSCYEKMKNEKVNISPVKYAEIP